MNLNRREFVNIAAAAAAAGALGADAEAQVRRRPRKASDKVALGKTGIRLSLLGVGTGTVGGGKQSNQTRLGQAEFTAMVRHAYDNGVNFFDTADQYGSHTYLREALKGIPRDKYVIQTKTNHRGAEGVREALDRFRLELGVDYLDILHLHCVVEPDWNTRFREAMDAMEEARSKGIIKAHGVSCHTYSALETAAAEPWVQVDFARFNPWGRAMDDKPGEPREKTPQHVQPVLQKMHAAGKGVIGMKILAEGRVMNTEDRLEKARESIRFALASGVMHAMVIGFESKEQITQVLQQTQVALADIDAARDA